MRHYDRGQFRHLNDGERYRDYEYLANDGWTGPTEAVVPPSVAAREGAAWRGGDLHGRAPGLGGGSAHAREGRRPQREAQRVWRPAPQAERGVVGDLIHGIRHPRSTVRRMLGGMFGGMMGGVFRGRGPKNWRRDDARIHDEVCERLTAHPEIDATDIEVSVDDGEVTLEGTVFDRHEKYLAEDVADSVLGVRDVHNRLRFARTAVTPSSSAAAARR